MAKPVYHALCRHSPLSPVLVVVPSRKQSRLTAVELLTLAAGDGAAARFLHAELADIQPFVERITDKTLRETVSQVRGWH